MVVFRGERRREKALTISIFLLDVSEADDASGEEDDDSRKRRPSSKEGLDCFEELESGDVRFEAEM